MQIAPTVDAVLWALRDFRRRLFLPPFAKYAKDGAPHFGNIAKIIKSETKGGPPVPNPRRARTSGAPRVHLGHPAISADIYGGG